MIVSSPPACPYISMSRRTNSPPRGLLNQRPLQTSSFLRNGPPTSLPKRLPLDFVQPNARSFKRHAVDVEYVAIGVQQPDKLVHLVQDDSRQFFTMRLRSSLEAQ